jgi:hypothetical protein
VLANPGPSEHYVVLDDVAPVASVEEMVDLARRRPRPIPIVAPPDAAPEHGSGTVAVTSYRPGHATLVVTASSPAIVLIRDSFAPGWRVAVDDRAVTPYPAAGIFFAVPVPAGVHRVALDYRAPGLVAGLLVAAGWLLVAATIRIRASRRITQLGGP